jgi:hypothetical protein
MGYILRAAPRARGEDEDIYLAGRGAVGLADFAFKLLKWHCRPFLIRFSLTNSPFFFVVEGTHFDEFSKGHVWAVPRQIRQLPLYTNIPPNLSQYPPPPCKIRYFPVIYSCNEKRDTPTILSRCFI